VNEAVQFVVESQFANRDIIKHFPIFRLVNRRESLLICYKCTERKRIEINTLNLAAASLRPARRTLDVLHLFQITRAKQKYHVYKRATTEMINSTGCLDRN
jgi:hypothetical protein